MVTEQTNSFQMDQINAYFKELKDSVMNAAQAGLPAHQVETELFAQMLEMGRHLYGLYLHTQGPGDLGDSLKLPDGRVVKRFARQHTRRLVTIFGEFQLSRCVYGTCERQAAECIPLDQRLELPASEFSYNVQDWSALLSTESAFGSAVEMLRTRLNIKLSVDSAEQICRQTAEAVDAFQIAQPTPPATEEGQLLVATIDHKGVPMVRPAHEPPTAAHRTKGQKPKKQLAAIGCVYSVDPHQRTPEELTEILFRERPAKAAPRGVCRRYWAALSRDVDGVEVCAQDDVLASMARSVAQRRRAGQPLMYLTDGQRSLQTGGQALLPADAVDVLDFMHVSSRLWEAAHLFHAEGSPTATAFVRVRVLRVLSGQAKSVISGLRQMRTKRLRGKAAERLTKLCLFMERNLDRMRYADYLAEGYPIATGVIEGACRHVIKDRMERAGMRWKTEGAQAMLQLRTTKANGCWKALRDFRIERETLRLYPHENLIAKTDWAIAL